MVLFVEPCTPYAYSVSCVQVILELGVPFMIFIVMLLVAQHVVPHRSCVGSYCVARVESDCSCNSFSVRDFPRQRPAQGMAGEYDFVSWQGLLDIGECSL